MNTLQMKYKDAFVLMAGSACTVMLLNDINRLFDYPIPGFRYLAWLAQLILFLWAGLLAGSRMNPRRWKTGLFALATLACLYLARHYDYPSQARLPWLHLMMFGVGMLWPGSLLQRASEEKGWDSLMLLLGTAFCFTAYSVVEDRSLWGGMMPEHRDMQRLMQGLTRNAEPLMTLLAGYFAVRFSFSEWGRRLGASPWFRGFVLVPAVMAFIATLVGLFQRIGFGGYWQWLSLLLVTVQPVTIWMVFSVIRRVKRKRHHG